MHKLSQIWELNPLHEARLSKRRIVPKLFLCLAPNLSAEQVWWEAGLTVIVRCEAYKQIFMYFCKFRFSISSIPFYIVLSCNLLHQLQLHFPRWSTYRELLNNLPVSPCFKAFRSYYNYIKQFHTQGYIDSHQQFAFSYQCKCTQI